MSRAFVKEDDGSQPEILPDRPISTLPNLMTPAGHQQMTQQLAQLERELAQLKHNDDLSQLSRRPQLERDIRYYRARLQSAIVTKPPPITASTVTQAAFGCTVTFVDEAEQEWRYQIVGEDEADVKQHKISWTSPLAKALLDKEEGEDTQWQKPNGAVTVHILKIDV